MRRLASASVLAALLMAQPAAARQSEPSAPPMSVERKAGCGVALVTLQKAMTRFPGALRQMPADRRQLMSFMLQALGAQGQVLLDEAFAEGGARGMAPSQVYTAGIDDMLAAFEGINPGSRSGGEQLLKRLLSRCSITPPEGLT